MSLPEARWRLFPPRPGWWLLLAFSACFLLTPEWAPAGKQSWGEEHCRNGSDAVTSGLRVYFHPHQDEEMLSAEYGFVNFNSDRLQVTLQTTPQAVEQAIAGFGYSEEHLLEMENLWQDSMKKSNEYARQHRLTQEETKQLMLTITKQYHLDFKNYLAACGFTLRGEKTIVVDMPKLVRRQKYTLRGVARIFADLAKQRHYGSEETIGAVVSLAQTAMEFQSPPLLNGSKRTGGIWLPLEALMKGAGDCDTKTALLAAILANWDGLRLLGVALPNHYLLGIRLNPRQGDFFVEYGGEYFVLVEAAGPAWLPPGSVSRLTAALLENNADTFLAPFWPEAGQP